MQGTRAQVQPCATSPAKSQAQKNRSVQYLDGLSEEDEEHVLKLAMQLERRQHLHRRKKKAEGAEETDTGKTG